MFAEAKVANRTHDAVPIDPNVRVNEPVEPVAAAGGLLAAMEANTDGQRDVRGNTTDDQISTRKLVRNPAGRELSATHGCVAGSKDHNNCHTAMSGNNCYKQR